MFQALLVDTNNKNLSCKLHYFIVLTILRSSVRNIIKLIELVKKNRNSGLLSDRLEKTRVTHLISKSCISSSVRLFATSSSCFMFSSFCFLKHSLLPLSSPKSPPFFNKIVDTLAWSRFSDGCCTTMVAWGALRFP